MNGDKGEIETSVVSKVRGGPNLILGEVSGVRGDTPRHERASASRLQKAASARGGRYDKEALQPSRVYGV